MNQPKFSEYLKDIVEKEGVLSKCYSVFHNYSILNQCIASDQFINRGQDVSPIATYKKWQELGRQVKKGAKAIAMIDVFPAPDGPTSATTSPGLIDNDKSSIAFSFFPG